MVKRKSHTVRKIRSTGIEAIKYTGKVTSKAATGLFKWATTDHSKTNDIFEYMPVTGFKDVVWHFVMELLIVLVSSLVYAVTAYVMIVYGLPLIWSAVAIKYLNIRHKTPF